MKKKIIHFIFNLGRGGAETMMVRVIKELDEYEHVIVTLFPDNHFGEEIQCRLVCLDLTSLLSLPLAITRFRKLVKREKPDLVHTHLFWPTIVARLSVPRKIPLITTIHAFIASSIEYKNWHIRLIDKFTYKFRKSIIIVVARGALNEYFSFLRLKKYKAYALYTFVDLERFNIDKQITGVNRSAFRLVSVGALRAQKNYDFLISAFTQLRDQDIELHIFGVGDLHTHLQRRIDDSKVKVFLKGEVHNIQDILPQYDLYVMSSTFEGFSLSVLEAMAMGIPLLLSDIPSFQEQCGSTAEYYLLSDINDFVQKLSRLAHMPKVELKQKGEKGWLRVNENFTLPQHMAGLRNIYSDALAKSY